MGERSEAIVRSLLDRLLDEEPRVPREPLVSRFQSFRELKSSVARDLEALLNTRQEALEEIPSEFTETSRSLLMYGLPDFTSFTLQSQSDRSRVRRALEQAVATFEPRLQRVRVTLEPARHHERALHFRVDALLRVEPAPEAVAFDAVLQLHTQEYVVHRQR